MGQPQSFPPPNQICVESLLLFCLLSKVICILCLLIILLLNDMKIMQISGYQDRFFTTCCSMVKKMTQRETQCTWISLRRALDSLRGSKINAVALLGNKMLQRWVKPEEHHNLKFNSLGLTGTPKISKQFNQTLNSWSGSAQFYQCMHRRYFCTILHRHAATHPLRQTFESGPHQDKICYWLWWLIL